MMKKITLLLILLTVSFGFSQSLPFDFEGAPVTGDFVDFNGGTATVIANPQINGINTSATVAQLVRNGGEVWAGSQVILTNPIDFSTLEGIRMKVFSTAPGIPVNLKIEDSGSGGATFIELPGTTTATNAWEVLEYDFSGAASGTYDAVVFLFDIGNLGDGSPSSTFLFDDVEQYDNSGGPMGPTLPFDFEGAPITSDFADFNGGTATVIPNPQSNGINTSATVAQLVRDGGEVWAGSQIILDSPIDFSTMEGIRMKVFSTAPGIPVNFKIEDSGSGGATFIELPGTTTATNAWEILEYDFAGAASGTYDAVIFLFDIGNLGDGSPSSTFLFDDVEQYDTSGGLDQIDVPIDFEGSTTNYTMTDFGGNSSMLVVDPEDAGNMVMRAIKSNVAETWAGTTFSTPAGLATALPITASDTKMNVRVWSPQAGLPIMLKIETVGDPTRSCETLTPTPVVAGWNDLEFDFSNERPGTAALNPSYVFNLGSIFFNFDVSGATAGELTFYFDDVQFGALLSTDEFDITSFKVFPNPTQENWMVRSNQEIVNIQVFDVLGKNVLTLSPNSQETTIDGSDFASGIYIAKINSSDGQKTIRLVKQ